MPHDNPSVSNQSEMLDVQLLDAFAQVEALLRIGREIQREALRARGVPPPVSPSERRAAGRTIRQHVDTMADECRTLADVVKELREAAIRLDQLLHSEEDATDHREEV
jgi:hypothetical protein